VLLVGECESGAVLGASGVGERGRAAEEVGAAAGAEMAGYVNSGAAVDEHLADQLVVYMALARGTSAALIGEPSLHTRTAVAVAEQLLGAEFAVQRRADGLWAVRCEGAGVARGGAAAAP